MIALEAKEKKYDPALHKARLAKLIANWDAVMEIVSQEIPALQTLEKLYAQVRLPGTRADIGEDEALLPTVLRCTKDIRDKYVLSRLAWDLGVLEELAEEMRREYDQ